MEKANDCGEIKNIIDGITIIKKGLDIFLYDQMGNDIKGEVRIIDPTDLNKMISVKEYAEKYM